MKVKSELLNITRDLNGDYQATFRIPKECIKELAALKGKALSLVIKIFRKDRSINANGYLWLLIGRLAECLNSTKWEVYKHELKKWSSEFTYMVVEPDTAKYLKQREDEENADFRVVEILNEGEINGKKAVQVLAYLGSHAFDSKQMSVLIDGVVQDCKELGITTKSDEEIERLVKEWNNGKNNT